MKNPSCQNCGMLVIGPTRSFCKHCLEALDEVDDQWFSTRQYGLMDNSGRFTY